jgi:hypothetical protein
LDPFALTSPDRIVEEYRKEGMDITIWHEDDYIFNGKLNYNRQVFANDTHEAKVAGYLWRQRAFLTSCIQEFKRRKNVRWTLLVDTDEYLTYNHFHNESEINEVRIVAGTMQIWWIDAHDACVGCSVGLHGRFLCSGVRTTI